MKNGDIIVFKVYSDWSIKKLFKMSTKPGEERQHYDIINKIRNRLIHRRQNIGTIYLVTQGKHGLLLDKYPDGIPLGGWDERSQSLMFEHLEYIIKVTNRNKPTKANWFKIRR